MFFEDIQFTGTISPLQHVFSDTLTFSIGYATLNTTSKGLKGEYNEKLQLSTDFWIYDRNIFLRCTCHQYHQQERE